MAGVDTTSYPDVVVACVLEGMKKGKKKSTKLFPRILSILEKHYDMVAETFRSKVFIQSSSEIKFIIELDDGFVVF